MEPPYPPSCVCQQQCVCASSSVCVPACIRTLLKWREFRAWLEPRFLLTHRTAQRMFDTTVSAYSSDARPLRSKLSLCPRTLKERVSLTAFPFRCMKGSMPLLLGKGFATGLGSAVVLLLLFQAASALDSCFFLCLIGMLIGKRHLSSARDRQPSFLGG